MSNVKPVIATVDTVIFNQFEEVLLIKRGNDPYKGMWALPGGRIDGTDKDILSAAYRELKEETNLDSIDLNYVTTVGNNTRDPRGFCLSNIFIGFIYQIRESMIQAGDDATEYGWYHYNKLPPMAFDHEEIMTKHIIPIWEQSKPHNVSNDQTTITPI